MALPSLIKDLLDPRSYPERPSSIELRQTHSSCIFLTPEFAYKVRKPVNFGFLDFSTLEKRLFFATEELRLNRRLAPDIYLDIVAITEKDGRAFMGGTGRPMEYAVKMKRLPEESILENLLKEGNVANDVILRIARTIADFHKKAGTNRHISGFGKPGVIKKNTDENFSQTGDYIGRLISRELFDSIKDYTETFLRTNKRLFLERVSSGFIRDCHGDMHCEHISITDGINIFDCIEFNERFRFSDTVADTAFLSMDLDFHNRSDLSRILDGSYFSFMDDPEGEKLLNFYKCYRAYVRGKVEGFKALEPEVDEKDRLAAGLNARHHFHLSGLYARGGFAPSLVIVCGLSGTGKSTLARALAQNTGFIQISSDATRKELAGLSPDEHRFEPYGKGIYSEEFTDRTYRELTERAASCLKNGRSVILDATFSKRRYFERLMEAFTSLGIKGAEWHIIECVADDETVRNNLLKRTAKPDKGAVSDAGWEVYLEQKKSFEPIVEPHLKLRAESPFNERLSSATDEIFS